MQETSINAPLDSQETIGQRIKFLLDELGLSIRKLARTLDVSDTNIRNYIERGSKPSSDVIEKILRSFPQLNSLWLITGQGEPFLAKSTGTSGPEFNYTGNNYGNSVGSNRGGTVTQHKGTMPVVVEGPSEIVLLRAMIKQLEGQLADKERTIQILLNQLPKP